MGFDTAILNIDSEIVRLRDQLKEVGSNHQEIQKRIETLIEARMERLKELESQRATKGS